MAAIGFGYGEELEAYWAGQWAAVAEEPRENCPHEKGSRLAEQWLAGYDRMMEE